MHLSRRLLSVKWLWASARLTNEDKCLMFNRKTGGYSKIITFTSDDSWEGVIYVYFYCFIDLTINSHTNLYKLALRSLFRPLVPCERVDVVHYEKVILWHDTGFTGWYGRKFCNSLDNVVNNSQSLSSFEKMLKIKLLSKYETVHKSFHLQLFTMFSLIDVQL